MRRLRDSVIMFSDYCIHHYVVDYLIVGAVIASCIVFPWLLIVFDSLYHCCQQCSCSFVTCFTLWHLWCDSGTFIHIQELGRRHNHHSASITVQSREVHIYDNELTTVVNLARSLPIYIREFTEVCWFWTSWQYTCVPLTGATTLW